MLKAPRIRNLCLSRVQEGCQIYLDGLIWMRRCCNELHLLTFGSWKKWEVANKGKKNSSLKRGRWIKQEFPGQNGHISDLQQSSTVYNLVPVYCQPIFKTMPRISKTDSPRQNNLRINPHETQQFFVTAPPFFQTLRHMIGVLYWVLCMASNGSWYPIKKTAYSTKKEKSALKN